MCTGATYKKYKVYFVNVLSPINYLFFWGGG